MPGLRDYLTNRYPDPNAPAPQAPLPSPEEIDARNAQAYRQNEAATSPFRSGLDQGVTSLEGSVNALGGLIQGAVGDVQGGRARLRRARATLAQARDYDTPDNSDFRNTNHLGDYALHQLGAMAPGIAATVAPAILTGGAGALVQGGLRKMALEGVAGKAADAALERTGADAVLKRTGQTLADTTAEQATNAARNTLIDTYKRRALAGVPNQLGSNIGSAVGATAGGTAISAGSVADAVDPNASDADFQAQSKRALTGAAGLGALQAIPGIALAHRYGFGAAAEQAIAKRLGKSLLQRVATEGAEQGALGAGIGAATVKATHAVHDYITQQASAAPAVTDYINAAAAGGLGGLAFGAPAGLRGSGKAAAKVKSSEFAKAFADKFKQYKADRPKPGEEMPAEGKTPAEHFDNNLAALKDDDPFGDKGAFGGVPFNEHDGTLNGPAKGLVDPARTAARANQYDLLFDSTDAKSTKGSGTVQRAFASMLGDDQWSAEAVPQVKAAAQAFTQGFDSLNKKQQDNVFGFVDRLPPEQRTKLRNALETSDEIVKRSKGLSDASEIPGFNKPFMTGADGKPLTIPGEDGKSSKIPTSPVRDAAGSMEPGLLSEHDAPGGLDYVSNKDWNSTLFTPRSGKTRPSADEENIRSIRTTADGNEYPSDINMTRAAAALSSSDEGKALLSAPGNRRVNAVLGVLSEAGARGHLIDPESIKPGLRVFPAKEGDAGVLTPAEAKTIRDQLAKRAAAAPRKPADLAALADKANALKAKREAEGGLSAEDAAQLRDLNRQRAAAKSSAPITETPGRATDGTDRFSLGQTGKVDEMNGDLAGRINDAYKLGPQFDNKTNLDDAQALDSRVRRQAETLGIKTNGRTTGQLYEDALHANDGPARRAALSATRQLAETDKGLADHVEQADQRHAVSQFAGERVKSDGHALIPYLKALKDGRKPTSEQAAAFKAIRDRADDSKLSDAQRKFASDLRTQIGGNADRDPALGAKGDATKRTPSESADEFAARQAKAREEANKPKATLKDTEAEAKAADDYARNPPEDFTPAEARAKAERMDAIAKKAAAKRDTYDTEHPAYQRLDDLRMNAKDAAAALRHVADQQDEAEKAGHHFDHDLIANNASGESSASLEAQNRLRDEKAAGQTRMVVERDGSVRPLFGVDAVDTFARDGQIIVQRGIGKDPWTVISSDRSMTPELARGKLNAARAKLDAEHAELQAEQTHHDDNVAPAEERKPNEPIRDAVERIKASPAWVKLGQMVDALKKGTPDRIREQMLVNRLTRAFGVDDLKIATHTDGPPARISGNLVSLNAKLRGPARMSALLHEFGHHLFDKKWTTADDATKKALLEDYKTWRKAQRGKESSLEVRASRAPFYTTDRILDALGGRDASAMRDPATRTQYLLSAPEFFADSIARALEQHEGVHDALNKTSGFYAKMAQTLKLTYDLLRRTSPELADTPAAVKDWVGRLWQPQDAGAPGADKPVPRVETASGTPPRSGFTSPHDVTALLSRRDRGILAEYLLRRGTIEQLVKDATPEETNALFYYGTQLETAINRGFALWAAGKLTFTDKTPLGPLNAMRDATMKMFGIASHRALAERILQNIKDGTTNAKMDTDRVVDRERRGELRAKIKATGSTTAKIELTARKAIFGTKQLALTKLKPITDKIMESAGDRLRETNNPALRQLAALVHLRTGEVGAGETMMAAFHQQRSKFWDQATRITAGLSLKDQARLLGALRTKGTLAAPALEAKRQALTGLLGSMHQYMRDAGVDVGHINDFWPVVVDPKRVRNREADFRAMLSDPKLEDGMRAYFKAKGWQDAGSLSQADMIDKMFNMASHEFEYSTGKRSLDDSVLPGGPQFRARVSEFIYQSGDKGLIKQFSKFQSRDLNQTLIPYISRAVRRAESQRRLGTNGDMDTSAFDQLMAKAKGYGATPVDLKLARDYVDSAMGTYGAKPSPVLSKVVGAFDNTFGTHLADADYRGLSNAMMAYQNIRVLGLGLFGNLIDPLGVWTRSSSLSQAFSGYKAASKAAFSKGGSYLEDMAHITGIVERHAMTEALVNNYGQAGDDMSSWSNRVTNALFRVNGMEFITKFSRLAALETGHKFLLKHVNDPNAHSARYLRELGLTAGDIKSDAAHPGYVKMTPKIEKALYQFVDESVLRPVATDRPLWHNDPHLKVLSQYKGYLYSFYDTITSRMLHEVDQGNMAGLAPIVGYLGVTLAAEMMREFVQYGPNGNPNRKDWGMAEYAGMAMERSGLAGPDVSIGGDVLRDPSRGNIPGQSITGPSVQQADEVLRTVFGHRSSEKTALHALPGQSIYQGYFHGEPAGGDASQPEKAEAIAGT